MKRLFLASSGLSALPDFVGEDPDHISMLFVTTAGNLDDDPWWIEKDRETLLEMGFNLYDLDLDTADRGDMNEQLMTCDIVYVAGGNTFYLLQQLRKSGFAKLLADYVDNGGLYAGSSAGAIVVGADIGPTAIIDQPDKVYGLKSTRGLAFVDIVPIPHCDSPDIADEIATIKNTYSGSAELVLIGDDQAVIVEGNQWQTVDSPRSELELSWLTKD